MIYDEQTKEWYINEFHLEYCKRVRATNDRLKKRLPLSHEEVDNNLRRIYGIDE